MGKTVYIQCYEGLSAKMMVDALLNLMPEQKTAKATVEQLFSLECPAEVKTAMIRRLPMKMKEFALPEGAEAIFYRAYDIWLRAKAAVQRRNIGCVEFQEKDYDEVIAMLAASICMERLGADTVICPIVYDGYGQIYIDHEPVSVPLPETLYILMGAEIAMHRMEREGAWVTPEGAAFLAACRTSDHLPENYRVVKMGTGRGNALDGSEGVLRIMVLDTEKKEFADRKMKIDELTKSIIDLDNDFPEETANEEEHINSSEEVSDAEEKAASLENETDVEQSSLENEMKPEANLPEDMPLYTDDEMNVEAAPEEPSEDTKPEAAVEYNAENNMSETATEEATTENTVTEDFVPENTLAEDVAANEIWKLECNIDDCGGEVLGYTMERLMEHGALDACYLPIYMKKNRPAYMLTVLCRPEDREQMEEIIFEETTTIGIRRVLMQRTVLPRRKSVEQTSLGEVAVKTMEKKNGEVPTLEYESVAAIARERKLPFREVYRRLEKELH